MTSTTPEATHDFTGDVPDRLGKTDLGRRDDAPPATRLPDPDLAPVDVRTDLQELEADLAAPVPTDTITLKVNSRPGYTVKYGTSIEHEQLEAWRKRAKDTKATNGIDIARLAALVLANTCLEIYKNGKRLVDADGDPLTFGSDDLRELLGEPRAADAVRKLYGKDSLLQSHSDRVIEAAGWGEDAEEVDPTLAAD